MAPHEMTKISLTGGIQVQEGIVIVID